MQYHGGTNFGRTSAHFVTTRYYDDAPLDEFGRSKVEPFPVWIIVTYSQVFGYFIGMEKEPKYGHLKHVHRALRLCKKALFWGHPRIQKLGPDTEVTEP